MSPQLDITTFLYLSKRRVSACDGRTVASIDACSFDDGLGLMELGVEAGRRQVALGGGRANTDHPPLKHAATASNTVLVNNVSPQRFVYTRNGRR